MLEFKNVSYNVSEDNSQKEILKNINIKKNNPKDIRRSVVHYNTFANKLDKSHLSSRIFNNDKTPILLFLATDSGIK